VLIDDSAFFGQEYQDSGSEREPFCARVRVRAMSGGLRDCQG